MSRREEVENRGGLDDLAEFLKNAKLGEFKPFVDYSEDGDFIHLVLENVSYYAEWTKDGFSVLRAQDDNRVIGAEINRIKSLVKPTRYTPREEVTEGWWFCSWAHDRKAGRFGIKIHKEDVGDMLRLKAYTDFLPVPAWLVEGIET